MPMDIHITRKGEQHGPYPEANAREMLAAGQLLPTDLAWHAGADGWKPLSEVLGAETQPPATPPPSPPPSGGGMPKRTMAGAVPAEEKPAEEKPEDSEPDDPDKISVTRKGEPIGPYSREKAKEYFASGQLLPTDWGWHDGMDDWKPINEVLGMAAPGQATAAAGKPGKGKKAAIIAGIVVLVCGLGAAGYFFLYPMLKGDGTGNVSGGGTIQTPEELVTLTINALKDNDRDAFFKLYYSQDDVKILSSDMVSEMPDVGWEEMAKELKISVAEAKKQLIEVDIGVHENDYGLSDEERENTRKEILLHFDKVRDRFDWSDLTVDNAGPFEHWTQVSNERLNQKLKTIWDKKSTKKGRITVPISSNGTEYDLVFTCWYSPSVGFVIAPLAPSFEGLRIQMR
jgi:hypothetical protein